MPSIKNRHKKQKKAIIFVYQLTKKTKKMNPKKTFRVELSNDNIHLNKIALRAIISNGNPQKILSIAEISTLVKMEKMDYPTSTENWIITTEETFLTVDEKRPEGIINLLSIQEVEIFEIES